MLQGILSEGGERIITKEDIQSFVEAGQILYFFRRPDCSGITMEYVRELVSFAHGLGALTITAVGDFQEEPIPLP